MPTYQFKNINTNEIEEHFFSYKQLDDFKKNNPNLQIYHSPETAPGFGDGLRMSTPGVGKADSTFEKYVIGRMKKSIPGNNLNRSHKTKIPREF